MTTLHLVRHAAHGQLGRILTGRSPGVPLTPEGLAQAAALAGRLADRPVAAVLSSERDRARQTAGPIAARLGHAVQIEPGLDEIDFGAWNGMAFQALDSEPAWHAWNRCRSLAAPPGGETMLAAQARVVALAGRLRRAHSGAEVVLVSHADVLRSLLAYALAVPLDLCHRIELGPASRSVLTLFDDGVRIECINLPPGA